MTTGSGRPIQIELAKRIKEDLEFLYMWVSTVSLPSKVEGGSFQVLRNFFQATRLKT